MTQFINRASLVPNHWQYENQRVDTVSTKRHLLLPLDQWLSDHTIRSKSLQSMGVVLRAGDDPSLLVEQMNHLEMIAIEFVPATDGRGFSIARELRDQLHFDGTIRALGPVIADQVPMLAQCGFDEFELADEYQAVIALGLLNKIQPSYQNRSNADARVVLPDSAQRSPGAN